jgi:hypothetical protein
MRLTATAQSITEGGEARHALIWEGHTTKLFRNLELPTPYYSSCLNRLADMRCIRQLSRGGGSAPSRWELLDDPSLEGFLSAETDKTKRTTRIGMVEEQVVSLNSRLQAIEDRFEEQTG